MKAPGKDGRKGVFYHHSTTKHQLWQPPTHEGALVGVHEPRGEVPAHFEAKKSENRHNEEHNKNSFALLAEVVGIYCTSQ